MSDEFEYEGQTGFQSACTEYAQKTLSLDQLFSLKSPNIYIWRAKGKSGSKFSIKDGDLVIVDRKLNQLIAGKLYVVILGSEFHLGQYREIHGKPMLIPQMIRLDELFDFEAQIWGGIVAIINIYTRPEGIS